MSANSMATNAGRSMAKPDSNGPRNEADQRYRADAARGPDGHDLGSRLGLCAKLLPPGLGLDRRSELFPRLAGVSDRPGHPLAATDSLGVAVVAERHPQTVVGLVLPGRYPGGASLCLRTQLPVARNSNHPAGDRLSGLVIRRLATSQTSVAGHRLPRVHAAAAGCDQQRDRTAAAADRGDGQLLSAATFLACGRFKKETSSLSEQRLV